MLPFAYYCSLRNGSRNKGTTMGNQLGHDLYLRVRARFIEQGTSLGRWCKQNDVPRQHARLVLTGAWRGPKGSALAERIIEASKAPTPAKAAA